MTGLTEAEKVLSGDTTNASIDEDVGGGKVGGEAKEAVLEEVHGGPHETPEVGRESGRVDEEHSA